MKNAYPDSLIPAQPRVVSPSLFYLLSGAAVVSLILRLSNLVQDSRVLWASLILFTASILLYHGSSLRWRSSPRSRSVLNTATEQEEKETVPPLQTFTEQERRAFTLQQSSQFMTPEEFRGEAVAQTGPVAPVVVTRMTAENIVSYQQAHMAWLERGALPDAAGRAVLIGVSILQEDLRGVIFARANLAQTDWTGTLLSDGNFSGATLCHSDLSQTDLRGADFRETDLRECHLVHVDGRGADMRGAELIQAKLNGSNLSGADLSEAYLSGADLTGVDLSGAKLDGAYLSGALLLGADLTGTSLEGIDLRRARYDNETRWPARFQPRSCGALLDTESSGGQ